MPIDAFDVSCAQLMRDLLAIAKFMLSIILITHKVTNTQTSATQHSTSSLSSECSHTYSLMVREVKVIHT